MPKRLLPQRVFPRGTRTKMMRFWVREDEWNAIIREALIAAPGGAPLSTIVVDRVLAKDGRMTSAEGRALLHSMFQARDELGRAAIALRECEATDHVQADALLDGLRAVEVRLSETMDRLAL